jgi:hypothetical protein
LIQTRNASISLRQSKNKRIANDKAITALVTGALSSKGDRPPSGLNRPSVPQDREGEEEVMAKRRAPQRAFLIGTHSPNSIRPAAICAKPTGRTYECTRPDRQSDTQTPCRRGPSAYEPESQIARMQPPHLHFPAKISTSLAINPASSTAHRFFTGDQKSLRVDRRMDPHEIAREGGASSTHGLFVVSFSSTTHAPDRYESARRASAPP